MISREYLEHNQYEFHARGWKSICPDCGNHNLYYTEDNGFAFCFNCNANYKVADRTFAKRKEKAKDVTAIRAYYAELASFYHGCLDDETRTYLHDRGINDTAITSYQIGYCPPNPLGVYKHPIAVDAGIASNGNPSLADRIVIPYLVEDQVCDMRGRATRHDQDPKYKSLFGSSEGRGAINVFNWDRAVAKARQKKYIIITEGEIKALVADLHGFPCVALPGMTTWRRAFLPEPDWRIIVIFDSSRDRKAQLTVDHALTKVHERLPTMYVGILPLLGEDKQDIDSFLLHKSGKEERLQYVIDTALPYAEYRRLRSF